MWVSLPAARLLLALADQRTTPELGWSWDEVADAAALPRVTHGRTILALRRWNVTAGELADVRPGTDAPGFRRLQAWRLERGIPRVVAFEHPKSRIVVDFGNVLSVDAFLASTGSLDLLRFVETPSADESPVEAPDGRYAHELIVPFTRARDDAPLIRPLGSRRAVVDERRRRFPPGSEWLYANLYGPDGAADRVIVDHVGAARRTPPRGGSRRSVVLHPLRRSRQAPTRALPRQRAVLAADVLPALHDALAPALADRPPLPDLARHL